ncbi:YceD family protein [Agrococcus sp. 1P02AA]|uniref:YceD family protein n=1 Tax=Agrococcus sp. 1P02AA TaxID=3132259 RepID=UPI0039A5CEF3
MPTPHPFVISVRDIVRRPGEMREVITTAPFGEKVGEGLAAVLPDQPVDLVLRLESVHEGILATGTAGVTALATCARCLTEFDLDLDVDFLELFTYDGASESDYLVVDESVDMLSVVRDAVVLALPFQPVDRPDCSGLDPETGERLEPGTDHVPAETIDPRWAALQGFAQDVADDQSDDDAQASKKE